MKHTIEQIHLASQYLAAAGISFLPKQDDDSHTNFGWDVNNSRLSTHSFGSDNSQIGLNFKTGELEWLKGNAITSKISLNGSTHSEVLTWINDASVQSGLGKGYDYNFHYELPYPALQDNDSFKIDLNDSAEYAKQLSTANTAMETFLAENKLSSPIRVWPHHFDLGIYAELSEGLFTAAGLAVPDTMVDELYFYASAYKKNEEVPTDSFSGLKLGEWRKDWQGATLPSAKIGAEDALTFLNETKVQFMNS